VIVHAPGRVNLIGEHTDYSEGLCLPMAIDRGATVRVRPLGTATVRARSVQMHGTVTVAVDHPDVDAVDGWGRFVAGAVAVLGAGGHRVAGADLEIDSDVPAGAGLSSSSALAVALVLALLGPDDPIRSDRVALARLALAAEVAATGVPGGLLDQMTSLSGVAGHALMLDCRTLAVTPVPLPAAAAFLVVHSGVARRLAGSAYAERRAACERAAARLGVPTLRDATLAAVGDDPIARHVVSENARVRRVAEALAAGDLASAGAVMLEGHASLRDDFAVSTPELDALVERFVRHGAFGARLTGAGFGGCVVGLVDAGAADACLAAVLADHGRDLGRPPLGFRVAAVGRARTEP
jgi:galactokinase